jgi:hypothetical protein
VFKGLHVIKFDHLGLFFEIVISFEQKSRFHAQEKELPHNGGAVKIEDPGRSSL